jgi:high-affinity iron transporter
MGSAIFIVWRESVEAILVVTILYAWIRERGDNRVRLSHLWAGVAAGVAAALGLAALMLGVQSQLAGDVLEAFQAAIVFTAAALITQMVLWMRRHGPRMKWELTSGMERAATDGGALAAASLAAVAVAREGAETVLFLYGLVVERQGAALATVLGGAVIGFLLALATAWLIAKGRRAVSWRTFFRVTEVVLLLLAASLLADGTEKLIGLGWLPPLVEPIWDTSAILDDGGGVGGLVAAFTGYRARPPLTLALVWFVYWALVALLLARTGRTQPQAARVAASRAPDAAPQQ